MKNSAGMQRLLMLGVLCLLAGAGWSDTARASDRKAVIQRSRGLLAEARTAFAQDQPDTALARLEAVLAEDQANPDAFYFRGVIHLSLADTLSAEAALVEGVQKAPMSRRLKLLLARIQIATGQVDRAEAMVDEILAMRPRDLDGIYLKGLIALSRGHKAVAADLWESTLADQAGGGQP